MAQPSLGEPANPAAATQQMSSASSPGPGLRQQMRTIVTLYELLTTVYFLLIEQAASTSAVATRASLNTQIGELRSVLLGEDEQKKTTLAATAAERRAAAARLQQQLQGPSSSTRRPAAGLLANLRPEHAQRIQRLAVIERILSSRNRSTAGSHASQPTIAEVAEAIHTLDELLVGLMQRARRHAQQQATIRRLMRNVQSYDDGMVQTIRRLAVLRDRCERLVTLGREEEQAMQRATESPLAYDDILRYARTLSQTTTAPPGFKFKMPSDEGADANGVAEANGEKSGKDARKPRLLDDEVADDDEAGGATAAGRGGDVVAAIPPYLQDKLPFPSADAMRRGAGEVRPPTWSMFQQGMLSADDDRERDQEEEEKETGMELDRPAVMERSAVHRPPAAHSQPVDDDDDGFGLDLN